MFALAASQCPDAAIVAGGYSYVLLSPSFSLFLPPAQLFRLPKTLPPMPTHSHPVTNCSQGAALMASAVSTLDATAQAQVKGVVLYGYTKNAQNDGKIPNYPPEQTKVFCNVDDGVCGGALAVTAGHLTYTADVDAAVEFLEGAVAKGGSGSGSGTTPSTTTPAAPATSSAAGGLFGGSPFGGSFGF